MNPIVEVDNLTLAYPVKEGWAIVVDSISFVIHKGEAFGLVGESGAGKSSVALEILEVLQYKGGKRLKGRISLSFDEDQIAYIPQDPAAALDPLVSIGDQMREIGAGEKEIHSAFAKVHLPLQTVSLKSMPYELSGGMLQRFLIALALVRKPRFLIADEPTSSLDVIHQNEIMQLFDEIKKQGITILFITHNLPLAMNLCERLAILKQGKIIEMGPSREIFQNPRHAFTRQLMQSVPTLTL